MTGLPRFGRKWRVGRGTDRARRLHIVKSVRRVLSTVVVLAAVIGGATIPAFAGIAHPVCAAKQHDCGATPKVSKCCCGDEQTSPTDSTPVQPRVEIGAPLSSMPAVLAIVHLTMTPHAVHTGYLAPPHPATVDLPTLFSSLLI
jgi:hypothetical protein